MENNSIAKAFLHILYQIVYILFIVPYHCWCNALKRLAAQRENKALKVTEIKSPWPMFTFLKRWFIDFFFDMLTALSWIIGILLAILSGTIGIAVLAYFAPSLLSWLRDLFVLLIKPFKKFLSWCSKPAQHLDIAANGALSNLNNLKKAAMQPAPIAEPVVAQPVVAQPEEEVIEEIEETEEETTSNFKLKPAYLIGAGAIAALAILAIVLLNKKDEPAVQYSEPVTEEVSAFVEEPVVEEPSMPTTYEFPSYEGYSIGEEMANLVTPDGFAGTMDGMTLQQQFEGWNTTSGGGLKQAKAEDNGYNYQFFFNPDGQLSGIALSHYCDDPWEECQTIDEKLGTDDSNRMVTLSNGSQVSPGYTGDKVYIFYFYPCAPDPNPAPRR